MSAVVCAWAVLDAEDKTVAVERDVTDAHDIADRIDGCHVRPLVLGNLDDVAPATRAAVRS